MTALEVLIDGIDFGEGPRWHDGRLWYSDFLQHAVFTVTVDGRRETAVEIDDQPSGLGWLPDGRLLLVSMHDRKVLRREHDGTLVEHADLSGVATAPCNDMVVAADGTAYVGNFGFDVFGGGSVRRSGAGAGDAERRGRAWRPRRCAFPNGSVITPDGRTLIVGESFGRCYTAFAIGADGSLSGRRTWADLPGRSPDGCSLDAEGAIWFANAAGTTVVRVREGGEITDEIEIGQPTFACALGGDDGRTLFVVSADGPQYPRRRQWHGEDPDAAGRRAARRPALGAAGSRVADHGRLASRVFRDEEVAVGLLARCGRREGRGRRWPPTPRCCAGLCGRARRRTRRARARGCVGARVEPAVGRPGERQPEELVDQVAGLGEVAHGLSGRRRVPRRGAASRAPRTARGS